MLMDEIGGLLGQLPSGLIVLTCGAGTLWLLAMIYFAVIRPIGRRRREREELEATAIPAYAGALLNSSTPAPSRVSGAAVDMPDLDLLTGGHDSAPPPRPVTSGVRRLGSADVKLSDGTIVHAAETLLVLRDPRDQGLILQVGDTGYKSLEEGSPARAAIESLLQELGQPMPQIDSRPAAPVSDAPRPSVPRPATSTATMPGVIPGDLPKFSEIKDEIRSRGAFRPPITETPLVPELNIAGAIEAFLQYKKGFDPEYSKRNIHIHSAPGGGVRIEVDGRFYDSVGEVADSDVRAFLQATIQEWQSRQ